MDKNTIIGFVLIGIVLFGFSWLNRPTPEQIEDKSQVECRFLFREENHRFAFVIVILFQSGRNDASAF